MTPIDTLLPRLKSVKSSSKDHWMALCPAHEDKRPSLWVTRYDDESISVKCWSGCTTGAILAAVELHASDLFPQSNLPQDSPFRRRHQSPPYREILEYLREDLLVLSIGFAKLKQGDWLTIEDLERLDTAALRCYAIATQSI